MGARRNETAKRARNRLSKYRLLLVAALVLTVVAAVGYVSLLHAATSAYAATQSTVAFDFDTGSPPPSLYQNTPFDYLTSGGVTAHFSSPSDVVQPAFSVQSTIPLGYNLSMFSGQWLYDNQQSRDYLDIRFNANLYSINLTFATIEPHGGPGIEPSYINLTAYMDSVGTNPIGWAWTRGVTSSEQNTQGTLSFNSGEQPFNLVRIGIPPLQPPFNPTDFFVDNIVITATPAPDVTPPVTTISLSGTLGNQGWYTSNVEVSLSATDDWSGVAKLEFSFDNVAWTTYTTSFSITNEGTTIVYYRSTDAVGNAETTKTQTVKIDKTIPTGSILINNGDASTTSTSVTLTLTSDDAWSSVSEVRYSNDGVWDTEQWEAPSATKTWILTTGYGLKVVYFQIKDNAGLISATYQDSITSEATQPPVDTTKPVAHAGPDRAVTEDTILTLDGSASTDNVAVSSYTWEFIDATTKTLTGVKPTYTFGTPGLYTITLNVTDAAGNWATDTVVIEVIDVTNPIADAGQDRTVNVNASVTFDALASTDNVGIVSYTWDCGDGTTHTGKTIAHTYNVSGTYTVTLTVEDAAGNMANHSINVTVLPTPAPSSSQASQLWIVLAIMAIGMGVTAALFLKKRK